MRLRVERLRLQTFLLILLAAAPACATPGGERGDARGGERTAEPAGAADGGETPAAVVQPGAPGEPSRDFEAQRASGSEAAVTIADARFMRGMIAHHRQALEMAALVPDRSDREEVRLLARRIERAQGDEIAVMERWLRARGAAVPVFVPHAGQPHAHPPGVQGMVSPEQMRSLAEASGDAFDRLFLEFMIFHHEGALAMVSELFRSEGGGNDADVYQFAAHVDSDQRIEIARMRNMRGALR